MVLANCYELNDATVNLRVEDVCNARNLSLSFNFTKNISLVDSVLLRFARLFCARSSAG